MGLKLIAPQSQVTQYTEPARCPSVSYATDIFVPLVFILEERVLSLRLCELFLARSLMQIGPQQTLFASMCVVSASYS